MTSSIAVAISIVIPTSLTANPSAGKRPVHFDKQTAVAPNNRLDQKGLRKKTEKTAVIQQAYERWLIENPVGDASTGKANGRPDMVATVDAFMSKYATVSKELAE